MSEQESRAPAADKRAEDGAVDAAAAQSPAAAAPTRPGARPRKRLLRFVLLLVGPLLVVLAAGYAYWTGGRYAGTENAYVKADTVVISAQVSGPIRQVKVQENQSVTSGDVLFVVDDDPYRVALARADAQLQTVASLMESLRASYRQKLEELQLARTNLAYAERELEREQALAEQNLGSDVSVDRARHEFDVSQQEILIVEQGLAQLRAQLGGAPDTPMTQHPAYLSSKAARDSALLDLEHTIVRAPFDGVASKVPVVGQYVGPGSAVMSVVSNHDVWIEANYKETDLTHVCVGQPVEVHVDTYPDREWHGRVSSISQATGAEFSVIPAQNATGNWVKVTQRIPLRIAVEVSEDDPALRTGMSADVDIDTGFHRRVPQFLRLGDDAIAGNGSNETVRCVTEAEAGAVTPLGSGRYFSDRPLSDGAA